MLLYLETTMTKYVKILGLLAVISICLIFASILLLPFQSEIYQTVVAIFSPTHHTFQVQNSQRIEVQIQPNADGIEWLGLRWSENGKLIEVYDSRSQIYAENLLTINAENGVTDGVIKTFKQGGISGLTKTLPFTLDDKEILWGGCLSKNIFFTGEEITFGHWEPRLRKDGQLIKSFQPIEYYPGRDPDPIGLILEFSNFSPDCRYFTMNISGQLWILDTSENSFNPSISARQLLWPDFDYPHQSMEAGWSPSSNEFVFGDGIFGIETYNSETHKRSWVLEPSFKGFNPDWSNSGKWISVVVKYSQNNQFKVIIISPTGNKISTLETCDYIETPAWSPVDDQIAFICSRDEQKYLVIWDLSHIDGN